jgi:4-amino-4-deoxy-L-arabinose transferase-like glycosyltransferase
MDTTSSPPSTLARSLFLDLFGIVHIPLRFTLAIIFLFGLGIRLLDLTDAPLDFNPSRQLRGAILARGLYFQQVESANPETRQVAISLGGTISRFEPPILETIVAYTYMLVGGEYLWIARILNSLFWLIGGIAIFALSRRAASLDGALVALLFYLLLPFSVIASRSFQPDPFMVMWLVLFLYTVYRWAESPTWKSALLAGVLGAIAVLVKVVAVYLVAGALIALALHKFGLRGALSHPQLWIIVTSMAVPSLYYYVISAGGGASTYISNWVIALAPQLLKFSFYIGWAGRVHSLINAVFILAALAGLWLSRTSFRALLLGLWVGYALYGISLPHQTVTHDYYHIQLVPIVALSLAPLAATLASRLLDSRKLLQAISLGLLLLAVAASLWTARVTLLGQDYRTDTDFWEYVGDQLPRNGRIIALTQQYGQPIAYYGWKRVSLWPISQELNLSAVRGEDEKEFEAFFAKRIEGFDFFLVTAFNQLRRQSDLEQTLYADYPIYAEGGGFVIFDLRGTLEDDSAP